MPRWSTNPGPSGVPQGLPIFKFIATPSRNVLRFHSLSRIALPNCFGVCPSFALSACRLAPRVQGEAGRLMQHYPSHCSTGDVQRRGVDFDLAQLDRLLELAHLSFGRIAKTNCADNNTKRSLPLKPKPQAGAHDCGLGNAVATVVQIDSAERIEDFIYDSCPKQASFSAP